MTTKTPELIPGWLCTDKDGSYIVLFDPASLECGRWAAPDLNKQWTPEQWAKHYDPADAPKPGKSFPVDIEL